ncbi:hypothetical protein [Modestobacter lapidis]
MSTLEQQIEGIRTKCARQIDVIRTEAGRTDEWRRQQLARIYRVIRDEAQAAADAHEANVNRQRRITESKVFGLVGVAGDPASLAISRRDAGDRAAQLKSESEALALLARAERSGDEPLARAIVERATEAGWVNVANAFLDVRPHLNDEVNELWQQAANSVQDDFRMAMTLGGLKPRELGSLSDEQIDKVADTPLEGAAALSGVQLAAVRNEQQREAMEVRS